MSMDDGTPCWHWAFTPTDMWIMSEDVNVEDLLDVFTSQVEGWGFVWDGTSIVLIFSS